MKSTTTTTITSNEEFVRLRIFEGDLQVEDAAAELIRLERAQHAETRRLLNEALNKIAQLEAALSAPASGALN